ncbi:MAG TPA: amidohydrolase family protein, partial [Clostridia bacterium]|nr:amidohydrolase family protein [Clostridia bacterium]
MRIVNGTVFLEGKLRRNVAVAFETDSVTALGACLPASETYDATGCYVVPGFIDTHIHGFAGSGVMEGEAAVRHMARRLTAHGVTAFLPSLTSAPLDTMAAAARGSARAILRPSPGAAVVGLHLEGPFLNPKRKGAADARFLREPSLPDFETIVGPYASLIALAPELPGGLDLVDALVARGIRVACGHSDATYEQAMEAVAHGVSVATHTFNAMSPIHHRAPGMAGASLTCPQLYA